MGRNRTLNAEPLIVANLTCFGFYVWAGDFLAAERLYAPTARAGSFVAHFLCCQSIELSLKAFLSLKGVTITELRRRGFGHNLFELYRAAADKGLGGLVTVEPDDLTVVTQANDWYDSPGGKKLQYFDVSEAMRAFKSAPELSGLENLAHRLQSPGLRDAVKGA